MNEIFDPDYSEARDSILDLQRECPDLIMFIREVAAHNGSRWQHHIPAMQRAIEAAPQTLGMGVGASQ